MRPEDFLRLFYLPQAALSRRFRTDEASSSSPAVTRECRDETRRLIMDYGSPV
jgi:hypothetical protein